MLFGFFLHQNRWVAFSALAVAFLLLSKWIRQVSYAEIRQVFALNSCRLRWIIYGTILGIGLAMILRWNQTQTLYPWPLRPFLMTAVLVGLTEEILFRGFFFGRLLQGKNATAAIAISALLHTAYKVAIFIPADRTGDLLFLGGVTFCAGLVLGYWRKAADSILPCIVFHVLFDFWVYADRLTPWWVW